MTKKGWKKDWEERIKSFATAVNMEGKNIEDALKAVVGEPSEQALKVLSSEEFATFEDLKSALSPLNIPVGVFRQNVDLLRGPKSESEKPAPEQAETVGPSLDVLPSVPDDSSFIEMLKVGGELKVGQTEVISAIKAAIAHRVGLFKLPETLKTRMEEFAESVEEPAGKGFWELRNLVVQRRYSDVLNVLGIEGHFMNEKRKNQLINRLEEHFWATLYDFHRQLQNWQRSWMEGAANPAMMVAAIASASGGGQMPPGMMAPPPTDVLRDAAESVINNTNKIFAGFGIPVARALAYDAHQIKKVLQDERLPASIGALNNEQMLKMLNIDVTADYVRLERNVVRYALSVMELPKVDSGQAELVYLSALLQLGLSIPWNKLVEGATGGLSPSREPERY